MGLDRLSRGARSESPVGRWFRREWPIINDRILPKWSGHFLETQPMPEHRRVKLFRNGRYQAIRIPVQFELPGDEATIHRDGDRLVIEPVRQRGLVDLLNTMKPVAEDFPGIILRSRAQHGVSKDGGRHRTFAAILRDACFASSSG
jgi:antitoxin VapB